MSAIVQVRLDEKTRVVLRRLVKRRGLTTSQILRKGIHLVAQEAEGSEPFRIIGLGEFDSGIPDLASNKRHLEGFGKKRRPASVAVRKVPGR